MFPARCVLPAIVGALLAAPSMATTFTAGNLVVAVEGNGVYGATSGSYTDNQATPLSLFQYSLSTINATKTAAHYVNSLVLPQTASGANYAISGEYGSSSEGLLQLSNDGRYLAIAGYGVNAAAFNANPTAYGTLTTNPAKSTALGQSGSLLGQGYTAVPRVVALIGANGSVDTTTALYGVFNGNNPRSVATLDGKTIYVSGQGNSPDSTGGVFVANRGSHSATAVTGNDANVTKGDNSVKTSQDTRDVQIVNRNGQNQLTISVDSKEGKDFNRDFVGTLGSAGSLPTGLANNGNGPTSLPGFGNSGGTGKVTLTAQTANGISLSGFEVNLSPEQYFFADANTLYVADSGMPKNDSVTNDKKFETTGLGGLQKWTFDGTNWNLAYTISAGLNLISNATDPNVSGGTTGLFGLTGQVVNGQVELFATNYVLRDTDQTYLFGLTDILTAKTKQSGEAFTILATAPVDSKFQGLSFAPTLGVPEPATWAMMLGGFGLVGGLMRRRRVSVRFG